MSRTDLARDLGVARMTIWRWEAAGLVPPPEHLSQTRSAYSREAEAAVRAFAELAR